jgi:hypothetical protein
MPRVVEWTEPPQMDTGAPSPAIERAGDNLVVAYLCAAAAAPEAAAVVRFDGVFWLHFGYPNDEGLSAHPFYGIGLRHYAFWEILESPNIPADTSFRHWIATFHDETLEVVATSARVVARDVPKKPTHEIAREYA